ncbi:hypothetical protein F2P81_025072 [Scophthalmus maximus]|uniref:Uncharacterized protein n=1 Tax=Scophthalmus maximus TaxID=52904 RepID=A0A6A4RTI9_SCOMX|nr:hypothetical protein F2P81_025072 [Scophthalmus maximus]
MATDGRVRWTSECHRDGPTLGALKPFGKACARTGSSSLQEGDVLESAVMIHKSSITFLCACRMKLTVSGQRCSNTDDRCVSTTRLNDPLTG